MLDDVQNITIELQRPRGSFPGRVEIGHFVYVDQHVVLTDAEGKPIGGEGTKRYIGADEKQARIQAALMLRARARSGALSRSFSAPIQYGRSWRGV
jgi:hypothetical protein